MSISPVSFSSSIASSTISVLACSISSLISSEISLEIAERASETISVVKEKVEINVKNYICKKVYAKGIHAKGENSCPYELDPTTFLTPFLQNLHFLKQLDFLIRLAENFCP